MSKDDNFRANNLAQQASGYQVNRGKLFVIKRPVLETIGHYIAEHEFLGSVVSCLVGERVEAAESKDWRRPSIDYLKDPSKSVHRKIGDKLSNIHY